MSLAIDALAILFFAPLAALGALGLVDPELAFRLENIFQLRSVELSPFGRFVQRAGGIVAVLVCVVVTASLAGIVATLVVVATALAVPTYYYRRYGQVTIG